MNKYLVLLLLLLPVVGRAEPRGSAVVTATWYSLPGRVMANGEKFKRNDPTIAAIPCNRYPMGATLEVLNPLNNRRLIVRRKDSMPCDRHDKIDLSLEGAIALDFVKSGRIKVLVTEIVDE